MLNEMDDSVPIYTNFDTAVYKLIVLPPELHHDLESTEILLKSDLKKNTVNLCTTSKTYALKKVPDSNSLLLIKPSEKDFEGYDQYDEHDEHENENENSKLDLISTLSSTYECVEENIKINLSFLPIYNGINNTNINNTKKKESSSILSFEELISTLPISYDELDSLWASSAGVEIDGICYILSDSLITEILKKILLLIEAKNLDPTSLYLDVIESGISNNFDDNPLNEKNELKDVIKAVLRKFSSSRYDPFALINLRVIKWMGEQILKKSGDEGIPKTKFIKEWKLSLPFVNNENSFNLDLLKKSYYEITSPSARIIYLNVNSLPSTSQARLSALFALKDKWKKEDLITLLEDSGTSKSIANLIKLKTKRKRFGKSQLLIKK